MTEIVSSYYPEQNNELHNINKYSSDLKKQIDNDDNDDNCSFNNDNYSNDSSINYNDNKKIKSLANEFLQIAKEKGKSLYNSNREHIYGDVKDSNLYYLNEYECPISIKVDKDNRKKNEILEYDENLSFLSESSSIASYYKNKRSNQNYSAEDFLKESNKNSITDIQDIIIHKDLNNKLIKENAELKARIAKFENFVDDIIQLMNINNLINIPSLIELFKKNLCEIESIRSLIKQIENKKDIYDESNLFYKGEKIISNKKYNIILNELIDLKKSLKEKDEKIETYKDKNEKNNELSNQLKENIKILKNDIKNYETIKHILEEKNRKLNETIMENNNNINEKNNKINEIMKKLNKVNDEYKNYKDSNEISSKNINDYIQKLKETTSLNDKSYKHFKNIYSQGNIFYYIESLKENIIKLEKDILSKNKCIELLKKTINDISENQNIEQQKLVASENNLIKLNENFKETIESLKKKHKNITSLSTHKDTINQDLKEKVKLYEDQISKLKNSVEENKHIKQDMKFLKSNIIKKDEMILANKQQIKYLTDNYEDCMEQLNNYKELNSFNVNKENLLQQKINTITKEKNNLQIKNEKLTIVLKKITDYLLSKYKDIILKKENNISINNSYSTSKKKSSCKKKEYSYNKNEIVEKIKSISENMLNINFKDVLNPTIFEKYSKSDEKQSNINERNQEFLNQFYQTKNELNKIINKENFESDLYNYFIDLIELSIHYPNL
ncbi:hypothetical protein LY90DRAFT_509823 [Neocallimastix californiae]|uniref:Uncharacterized protein n=1 Tax=Neocallimastix californiae TaxID=1754190 RepID=A0A1Y2C970_9FUNG|nr:hypothetical protein LY90DRAFT_509823 [Neocallimastix californiae]|eukprot:ORY43578.1 hypothetical protein LY90DRAFT_509823 [Neocallimastix californiae]